MQRQRFVLLPHSPYSPDLAPYHLSCSPKEAQGSRRFASDVEIKKAVQAWIREAPEKLLSQDKDKLVELCRKWIDLQGRQSREVIH